MKKFLFILILILASTSITAYAASVSITSASKIEIDTMFEVVVDVQPSGESINSFDISISYSSELVSFEGYKEENSIKKIWIKYPNKKSNTIEFSGIIPGGVDGVYNPDKKELQAIPLVRLLFKSLKEGRGMFRVVNSIILKNDGLGTSLSHENNNAQILISGVNKSPQNKILTPTNKEDTKHPEPLTIQFIEGSLLSRTPSLIIFSTVDADSGIEKYQLKTGSNEWKDITSPLPINKQLLANDIIIRAVDFKGNIEETGFIIPGMLSPQQLILILLTVLICGSIIFKLKRKR